MSIPAGSTILATAQIQQQTSIYAIRKTMDMTESMANTMISDFKATLATTNKLDTYA